MATSMKMSKRMWAWGACALGGMLLAGSVSATPTLVTSRSALGGSDHIDWANAGACFALPTNPFTINSQGGLGVLVSKFSSGTFEIGEQSNCVWSGNFAPGDTLLFTLGGSGPIALAFAHPVFGGGAQIQRDAFGSFTATIEAFDADGHSLASFTLDGNSTSDADNSAIFIGMLDSSADISRINIGLTGDGDFAINQFDIAGAGGKIPVPEPNALGLFGMGLAGVTFLLMLARRRRLMQPHTR